MNRSFRESAIGDGRNFPLAPLSQHRRGLSLNGLSNFKNSADNNLDLFSKNRHSLPVAASDKSDVSLKLGRLSVGSAKQGKSGLDDLLSSTDGGGKHDYDWLLTPPGTPIVPSTNGNESQRASAAPRGSSRVRSTSTNRGSRRMPESEVRNMNEGARLCLYMSPEMVAGGEQDALLIYGHLGAWWRRWSPEHRRGGAPTWPCF